nr:putative multidrug resistance protein [Tanacetum cinerariifolium]
PSDQIPCLIISETTSEVRSILLTELESSLLDSKLSLKMKYAIYEVKTVFSHKIYPWGCKQVTALTEMQTHSQLQIFEDECLDHNFLGEVVVKVIVVHDFFELSAGHVGEADELSELSGGQKQRITLARAIIKNAAILLLDEATSALDSVSESFIQDKLQKMMNERLCIVFAHHLSMIQKLESIAVIKDRKVTEQGFQNDVLNLPLARVEAILASDDLEVALEDAVYEFDLKWSRI